MGRSDVGDGELLCFRGDGRMAFRLTDARLTSEDDWRSHYEQGKRPRRAELGSALDHMALSMWSLEDLALDVNERFGRKLGKFVVAVELRGEEGVWFAETGSEGHYAVWGRPESLQRSVLAVNPI